MGYSQGVSLSNNFIWRFDWGRNCFQAHRSGFSCLCPPHPNPPSPSCWQNASLDSGAFSSLYRAVHDIVVGCLQSEGAPQGGSGRKSSLCNLILEGHPTLSVVLPSPRWIMQSVPHSRAAAPTSTVPSQAGGLNEGFYTRAWISRALDRWTPSYNKQPATWWHKTSTIFCRRWCHKGP